MHFNIFFPTFAICWDEYSLYKKALSGGREQTSRELRYVLANRVRIEASQRASAVELELLLRQRTAAALPPLPPEPYEIRTTFSSNHKTLREHLLLSYYAVLCTILFFSVPIWLPISGGIACLEKVGLWLYIARLIRYLVLSPILFVARAASRPLQ